MRFEGELVRHGECGADFAFGAVFALDIEFFARDAADGAVGEVEREDRGRVGFVVVVVFELVEVFGGADDVVAGVVAFKGDAGFSFQGAGDERFGGGVVLVGEGDVVDRAVGD